MAVISLFRIIVDKWHVVLACSACLGALLFQALRRQSNSTKDVPFIGMELGSAEKRRKAYMTDARSLFRDGYQQFKDRVFGITTTSENLVVVVPPRFLDELGRLPDEVLSASMAVADISQDKYTKMEITDPIISHAVRGNLTMSLSRLNDAILEELRKALSLLLPTCDEWTSVNISEKLQRIVAVISGRVFVGPELCGSDAYLDAAIHIAHEASAAVQSISTLPPWKRPFLSARLPELRALRERQDKVHSVLRPVLEKRIQMNEEDRPDDMLTWIISSQKKHGERSIETMAKVQTALHLAAIGTTSEMATNAFYNLAAMPELVPELREEIRTVLEEHDGVVSTKSLQAMKKLDSFLKETARLYPPFLCKNFIPMPWWLPGGDNRISDANIVYPKAAFERKVLRTFTLSNGQVIPAGALIKVPSQAIMTDPALFPDPDRFDAFRFYDLQQQKNILKDGSVSVGASVNQFVNSNKNSLVFGYGRHACPGRFLAADELKMILVYFLQAYEIRLEEGESRRYRNLEFAAFSIPDPTKTIQMKKLQ